MQLKTNHFRSESKRGNIMLLFSCLIILIFFSTLQTSTAHQENHDSQDSPEKLVHNEPSNLALTNPLGVVEHLGAILPRDLSFFDEHNTAVRLSEIIIKPTIILPVYFHCPNACPLLMSNLAMALNDVVLKPGEDYQVIVFSFDPDDTPEQALKAKNNYNAILKENFPETAWTFLTANQNTISTLTNAIGFQYQQTGKHFFTHASVLLTVSETGKIIRYIYGPNFLPFDISMALSEAEKNTPSVSIKKLLSFCFSYDPVGKKYVFNTFKLVAISTIIILLGFYILVLRKGNR